MRMLGVSLWGKPVLCKNEPTVSGYVAWRGAQKEVLIFHLYNLSKWVLAVCLKYFIGTDFFTKKGRLSALSRIL